MDQNLVVADGCFLKTADGVVVDAGEDFSTTLVVVG